MEKKKAGNCANKVDMAVMDKEKKTWILIEGTVCGIYLISDRWKTKQYYKLIAILRRQYHIILTGSWEKIYSVMS